MKRALRVHNWDKRQTYRRDRGAPPWIKVHRCLLTSSKWASLTDAEKGQLVSLWLIAADNSGDITNDARVLRKVCMLDDEPNINKFIELGLLESSCQPDDNQMTTNCQPDDAPEERREEERREEESVASLPFLEIVLKSGKTHSVYEPDIAELQKAFPLADVKAELIKCKAWNDSNPAKRKTAGGIKRHIFSWIENSRPSQTTPGMDLGTRKPML